MGFIHIHILESLIGMGFGCRVSECDGHISAGEHMCNQSTQDNDMQLSEYSFVRLQKRINHVTYLLESDEVHRGLC